LVFDIVIDEFEFCADANKPAQATDSVKTSTIASPINWLLLSLTDLPFMYLGRKIDDEGKSPLTRLHSH